MQESRFDLFYFLTMMFFLGAYVFLIGVGVYYTIIIDSIMRVLFAVIVIGMVLMTVRYARFLVWYFNNGTN